MKSTGLSFLRSQTDRFACVARRPCRSERTRSAVKPDSTITVTLKFSCSATPNNVWSERSSNERGPHQDEMNPSMPAAFAHRICCLTTLESFESYMPSDGVFVDACSGPLGAQ